MESSCIRSSSTTSRPLHHGRRSPTPVPHDDDGAKVDTVVNIIVCMGSNCGAVIGSSTSRNKDSHNDNNKLLQPFQQQRAPITSSHSSTSSSNIQHDTCESNSSNGSHHRVSATFLEIEELVQEVTTTTTIQYRDGGGGNNNNSTTIRVLQGGCLGLCSMGPNVSITTAVTAQQAQQNNRPAVVQQQPGDGASLHSTSHDDSITSITSSSSLSMTSAVARTKGDGDDVDAFPSPQPQQQQQDYLLCYHQVNSVEACAKVVQKAIEIGAESIGCGLSDNNDNALPTSPTSSSLLLLRRAEGMRWKALKELSREVIRSSSSSSARGSSSTSPSLSLLQHIGSDIDSRKPQQNNDNPTVRTAAATTTPRERTVQQLLEAAIDAEIGAVRYDLNRVERAKRRRQRLLQYICH